jgi:predicted O-methyltransferase YrrM
MRDRFHMITSWLRHKLTARANGHGVHSPFAYRLCEEVFYNDQNYYHFSELGELRKRLLSDRTALHVRDLGAGSRTMKGEKRIVADIARKGISSRTRSESFYRLVRLLRPDCVLELGTSLGLNALYFALPEAATMVVTIEGSPELANYARGLISAANAGNVEVVEGEFSEVLPAALGRCKKVGLLYIDGNHRRDATVSYFEQCLPYLSAESVVVVDDIYWSREMTAAWKQIAAHPSVTLAIDTWYCGFVFFTREIKEKVSLKMRV